MGVAFKGEKTNFCLWLGGAFSSILCFSLFHMPLLNNQLSIFLEGLKPIKEKSKLKKCG